MKDERLTLLAKNLVNYSCGLKKGEKLLIETYGIDNELINEIIRAAYAVGAYPFVETFDNNILRPLISGTDETHCKLLADFAAYRMSQMDAYLGIRGGNNSYELSDVPGDKMKIYSKNYLQAVQYDIRVTKTKWCVLRYPTPSMAQLSGMSTEAFEKFYFDVCNLDYSKMDKAMNNLKALMDRTDKVRLLAADTNLTFSIKNIGSKKCSGHMNIPDGEVYSAPVKDSVNGYITYNAPSIEQGLKHENVRLTFKNGKIVESTGNYPEKLKEIFDTDEGARYVGEFALGVNPYITKPMGDILFDEKISGSIHFTPGNCYEDAYNGNKSSIHWDLVKIMTKEYGGGEIYFDDVLIRKDGIFVTEELKCLNPENLI